MIYTLTVFLSAFLLFQIQPLIGKCILPWFGGVPSVWSTSMLFFQVLLVGGHAYAHWLVGRLSARKQRIVHLALLGISLCLLLVTGLVWDSPITPGAHWKPSGKFPMWQIPKTLAVSVGLPYFILSTTNPLMQTWLNYHDPERSPYRLYALSNAGSLLGLVTYPFLVEPALVLKTQANLWAWGYIAFAVCVGYGALRTRRLNAAVAGHAAGSTAPKARPLAEGEARPGLTIRFFWVALSACASVMLLATTNQISQEVSVIPFLWVLPLTLYLLSFILCFSSKRWYSRIGYTVALFIGNAIFCWLFYYGQEALNILVQIGVYSLVLFLCCMICHGELARLKPHPRYLTSFYLLISTGGALGGIAVNLVAPYVFTGFWEFPVGLLGCWGLLLIAFLLTKEAFDTYSSHLQPDGILALHISNRHMDLRPVVQELADYFRLGTALINDEGDGGRVSSSMWMLVTRSEKFLEQPQIAGQSSPQPAYPGFRLWTDDYSNLFQILNMDQPSGMLSEDSIKMHP